jgi:hypothetical protein
LFISLPAYVGRLQRFGRLVVLQPLSIDQVWIGDLRRRLSTAGLEVDGANVDQGIGGNAVPIGIDLGSVGGDDVSD